MTTTHINRFPNISNASHAQFLVLKCWWWFVNVKLKREPRQAEPSVRTDSNQNRLLILQLLGLLFFQIICKLWNTCSPSNNHTPRHCLSYIGGQHENEKLTFDKFNIVSSCRPVVPRGSNLSFRLRALIMYERGGGGKKGHSHLWQTRIPAGRWVTLGRSRRRQSSPAPRRPWEARRTTTPPRCSRAWSHAEPDGRGHISAKRRQEESPRHLSQWEET